MCSKPKIPKAPPPRPLPPPPPTPADTSVLAATDALRLQRRAQASQRQRAFGAGSFLNGASETLLNRVSQLSSRPSRPKPKKKTSAANRFADKFNDVIDDSGE